MGATSMSVSVARAAIAKLGVVRPPPKRVRNARVRITASRHWKARARAMAPVVQVQEISGSRNRRAPRVASNSGKMKWGVSIRCFASSRSALSPHTWKSPGTLEAKTARQIAGVNSRSTTRSNSAQRQASAALADDLTAGLPLLNRVRASHGLLDLFRHPVQVVTNKTVVCEAGIVH